MINIDFFVTWYVLIIFLNSEYIVRRMIVFIFKIFIIYIFFVQNLFWRKLFVGIYNSEFWCNFSYDFRTKIAQDIERLIHQSDIIDRVVYDLDNSK